MARFGTFKRDMIDVAGAGPRLAEALKLMDEVGWDSRTTVLVRPSGGGPRWWGSRSPSSPRRARSTSSPASCPEAVAATFWILIGVGGGTLVLGTALAALVSFFEFPGRRWIEWALVLPLAMPGYVFTLFALGLDVPGIRSTGGAVWCSRSCSTRTCTCWRAPPSSASRAR